ncbi:hypothetical protein ACLOJK_036998 [Asimina triloba]
MSVAFRGSSSSGRILWRGICRWFRRCFEHRVGFVAGRRGGGAGCGCDGGEGERCGSELVASESVSDRCG